MPKQRGADARDSQRKHTNKTTANEIMKLSRDTPSRTCANAAWRGSTRRGGGRTERRERSVCELGEVRGAGVALVAVGERRERKARHDMRRQRFTRPGEELVMRLHRRCPLAPF
jgi:hypothetical protein